VLATTRSPFTHTPLSQQWNQKHSSVLHAPAHAPFVTHKVHNVCLTVHLESSVLAAVSARSDVPHALDPATDSALRAQVPRSTFIRGKCATGAVMGL
jgi:hypothetical protein